VTAPDYRTVTTQDDGTSGVGGVAQGARERGAEVGDHAKSAAADVKDTAAERARDVAGEARAQARDLVGHTRETLVSHADEQTNRLSETLDQLADDLRKMAGSTEQDGLAGRVVGELAQRTDALAQRMRGRSSADLLDDIRDFGRRRPGAFLTAAAGLGLLAGRLGRGLKDANSSDQQSGDAWATETYGSDYSTAGLGVGAEPLATQPLGTQPVGSGYGTTTGTGYGTTAGDYTSGTGAATPGAGTEYGTGAGAAGTPSDVGTPAYDTTALETPDRDAETGAHLGSAERDRTSGGSGYGA
jgi:hypothetical protein